MLDATNEKLCNITKLDRENDYSGHSHCRVCQST